MTKVLASPTLAANTGDGQRLGARTEWRLTEVRGELDVGDEALGNILWQPGMNDRLQGIAGKDRRQQR